MTITNKKYPKMKKDKKIDLYKIKVFSKTKKIEDFKIKLLCVATK